MEQGCKFKYFGIKYETQKVRSVFGIVLEGSLNKPAIGLFYNIVLAAVN